MMVPDRPMKMAAEGLARSIRGGAQGSPGPVAYGRLQASRVFAASC